MTQLRAALDDYVSVRRSMGYKFKVAAKLLADFVTWLEAEESAVITTAAAMAWATDAGGHPNWWGKRLSLVRGFARYLNGRELGHEVPLSGVFPTQPLRATPYLYSDDDINRLMVAARSLRTASKLATVETVIGLLAVTGMRIGEALGLDVTDIDWDEGVLTVRSGKFGKSREVMLHSSTVTALHTYDSQVRRTGLRVRTNAFFVSTRGDRLKHASVQIPFQRLVQELGLLRLSPHHGPRPHDLRHTFVVRTLLDWYRAGVDVQRRLHLLSAYLGHTDPAATYWYLYAAPELMAIIAERLEPAAEGPS